MAFSEDVVKEAWGRAGGLCECPRYTHGHEGVCEQVIKWDDRESDYITGWDAHRKERFGTDTVDNCEILCSTCMKHVRAGS